MPFSEGQHEHDGTFWGSGSSLGLDLRGGDMGYDYTPKICKLDYMYVKTCLNFKGRNHPKIWGPVEGKDSHSLEKVNKSRLLSQIPLSLICLGDLQGEGIFLGSPW